MEPASAAPKPSQSDLQAIEKLKTAYEKLKTQMHRVIVGQDRVLDELLTCVFSRGHALIVGVPGLAKTLMIRTVSRCLDLNFNRIQFTPDLMPSDITGTEVIYEDKASGERSLKFIKGPIFANIILADEINRTPPKTQAALLEAMQELQVTVGGKRYELTKPFFVLATQNPIEQEGTYPLPEAQLDRFMFNIIIVHPPLDEEMEVVRETTKNQEFNFERTITGPDIVGFQKLVRRVPVAEPVMAYALDLVRKTRPETPDSPDFIKKWIEYGASVRAAQYLILGGKARALLSGRYYVDFDDIRSLAPPVLRHRILTNFHAESERVTTDDIVEQLLDAVGVPQSQM